MSAVAWTWLADGSSPTITSLAFGPDGTALAAAVGGTIRLWDVAASPLPATLPASSGNNAWSVAFSPDGTTLAAAVGGRSGAVQLWDVASRQLAATLPVGGIASYVGSVAFSPGGTVLAVDITAGTQLWDVSTAQQVGTLPASDAGGAALTAFSPRSTLLSTITGNGRVQLWKVPYLTDPVSYLCTLARQPFPPAEWQQYAPGVPYQKTCP